jgi:hypothetical protein
MRYPSRAIVRPLVAVLLGLSASLATAPGDVASASHLADSRNILATTRIY